MVSVSENHLEVKLCDPQEGPEQKTPTTQNQVELQEAQQNLPDSQPPREESQEKLPDSQKTQEEQKLSTTQETLEKPQEPQDDTSDTLQPQETPKESQQRIPESRDDPQEPQETSSTTQNIEQEPPEAQTRLPEDTTAAVEQACQKEVTVVKTSESGTREPAKIITSSEGCQTPGDGDTAVTPRDPSSQESKSSDVSGPREERSPITDSDPHSVSETPPSTETTNPARPTASQTEVEAPPKSHSEEETAVCSKRLPETVSPPRARVVLQEDGSVLVRVRRTGGGTEKQIQFSNKLVFDLD